MRKAYFCYEKGSNGRWNAVVYFDETPIKLVSYTPERSPVHEITDDLRTSVFPGVDDSINFDFLKHKWPAPTVIENTL